MGVAAVEATSEVVITGRAIPEVVVEEVAQDMEEVEVAATEAAADMEAAVDTEAAVETLAIPLGNS